MPDDYTPIAREGDVTPPTPRWKTPLRGGRPGLPATETGRRLVVVDGDGKARPFSGQTAGDRQWRDARTWMMVDVASHTLPFAVHVDSPFGHAGFDATIDVECRVSDPVAVAEDRIDGVRDRLAPAVGRAVRRVIRAAAPAGRPEAATADEQLLFDRQRIHELLDDELQEELKLGWLSTIVVSVAVEFDQETAEYYRVLRKHRQEDDVIIADVHNTLVRETETEKVVEGRRGRMKPHVTDARALMMEMLAQDPSPGRFDMVLAELRELDTDERRRQDERLLSFTDNGLLDEHPELKERVAKYLLDAFPDTPELDGPEAAPPVQVGDAPAPELPAEDDPGTVDHEGDPKTEEPRPEGDAS
jgi:hypothetical protein